MDTEGGHPVDTEAGVSDQQEDKQCIFFPPQYLLCILLLLCLVQLTIEMNSFMFLQLKAAVSGSCFSL